MNLYRKKENPPQESVVCSVVDDDMMLQVNIINITKPLHIMNARLIWVDGDHISWDEMQKMAFNENRQILIRIDNTTKVEWRLAISPSYIYQPVRNNKDRLCDCIITLEDFYGEQNFYCLNCGMKTFFDILNNEIVRKKVLSIV